MALKQEAVPAKSVQTIEKPVDDGKHYNIVIQLGCNRSWRRCSGGKWMPDPDNNTPGRLAYRHVPKVHKAGPLSGKIVNGLIGTHNKWVRANREGQQPGGDVGRMFAIVDMEPTSPPRAKARAFPFDLEAIVSKVAESAATAAVKAMSQRGAVK